MRIGAKGLALIQHFEDLKLEAYRCPAGVLTIGWGHTSAAGAPRVYEGMRISQAEADQILRDDLAPCERTVERLIKAPLLQREFDALVSFEFNTGELGNSTLLKKINAGAPEKEIRAAFMMWVKHRDPETRKLVVSAGLKRRRTAEADLFSGLEPVLQ